MCIRDSAHSFYCMADVFFVGAAVGSDGLAALNVALPVFTLFSAFSLMVGVGTATTASILTGQGETHQTDRVFTQSMALLAVVGLTMTILTSVFIVPLARIFGATDRILTEVVDYMRPINLLAFAYIFSGALGVIIRADGNPRLVMIAGTTGNIDVYKRQDEASSEVFSASGSPSGISLSPSNPPVLITASASSSALRSWGSVCSSSS